MASSTSTSEVKNKGRSSKRLSNLSRVPADVRENLKDFEKSVLNLSSKLSILDEKSSSENKLVQDISTLCAATQKVKEISSKVLFKAETSLYRSYVVVSVQQDIARQVYETKLILNPNLLKQYLEHFAMKPLSLQLHRKYSAIESKMKTLKRGINVANKLVHDKEVSLSETPVKETKAIDVNEVLSAIESQFDTIQVTISFLEDEISKLEEEKKLRSANKFDKKHRNNICYQLHQLNLNDDLLDENVIPNVSNVPISNPADSNIARNAIKEEKQEQSVDPAVVARDTDDYDDCDVSLLNVSTNVNDSTNLLNTTFEDPDTTSPISPLNTSKIPFYGSISMDDHDLRLRSKTINTPIVKSSATTARSTTAATAAQPINRTKSFNNAKFWHGVKMKILAEKRPNYSFSSFEEFAEEVELRGSESASVSSSELTKRVPRSWKKKYQLLQHSTVSSHEGPHTVRVTADTPGDWRHIKPFVVSKSPAKDSYSSSSSAAAYDKKATVSPLLEAIKVIDAYLTVDSSKTPAALKSRSGSESNPFGSFTSGLGSSLSSSDAHINSNLNVKSKKVSRALESSTSDSAVAAPVVDGSLVALRSTYKRSESMNSDDTPASYNSKLSGASSTSEESNKKPSPNKFSTTGGILKTASGDEDGIASVDKSLGTIKGTNMLDITKKGSVSSNSPQSSSKRVAVVADVDLTTSQIVEAIHSIYQTHNPSKLDEIPKLLAKYKGKELELLGKVRVKYNVPANSSRVSLSVNTTASTASSSSSNANDQQNMPLEKLLGPDSSPRLTNTRSSSVFDLSGLNNTPTGSTGKNPFAKTESPTSSSTSKNLFGFNASPNRTSPSPVTAAPAPAVSGFGSQPTGSLFKTPSSTLGISSGTPTPFGSATSGSGGGGGSLFTGGFQSPFTQSSAAAATTTPVTQSILGQGTPTNVQEVQARVTAIYQQYNPMKISEIPSLMEKYRGRELQLIANLEKKYNVPPAQAAPVGNTSVFGGATTGGSSLFNRSSTVGGTVSPFGNATNNTPVGGSSLFGNRGSVGVGGTVSPFGQQQQQQASPFGQPVQSSPFGNQQQQQHQQQPGSSLFGGSGMGSVGVMGTQSPFAKSMTSSGTSSMNSLGIAGGGGANTGLFGQSSTPFGGTSSISSGSHTVTSSSSSLFGGNSSSGSMFGAGGSQASPMTPFGQPAPQQQGTPNSIQEVYARVTAIYQQYNPMKISEIPSLMEKYRGRELQLIANLEKKYNVPSGGMQQHQQPQSVFGQANTAFGGGQAQQQQQQHQSLFGGSPAQNTGGGGLFGAAAPQQSPFGNVQNSQPQQSPFATQNTGFGAPSSSGFGGSSGFGQAPQQSPFGQQQHQQNAFGSANTFGTASPQQQQTPFGGGGGGGVFGSTPQATGALSLFNRSPVQVSPFGAGGAASTTRVSGFGTPTPFGTPANTGTTGSLFGNRPASGSVGGVSFGATNTMGSAGGGTGLWGAR